MLDVAAPRDEATLADAAKTARFDYAEAAELFTRRDPAAQIAAGTSTADAHRARSRSTYRNSLAYRRFASGAEAIRYAIEDLSPRALAATVLVVNGDRHEANAIRTLHASPDYPLRRRNPARGL